MPRRDALEATKSHLAGPDEITKTQACRMTTELCEAVSAGHLQRLALLRVVLERLLDDPGHARVARLWARGAST